MGEVKLLFALANFILCVAAAGLCLCRLNLMHPCVRFRVRLEYALYLTCALASAFQPMWDEWPGWGSLALAVALLFGVYAHGEDWRRGPPLNALRKEST